jgi:hypothetical protein
VTPLLSKPRIGTRQILSGGDPIWKEVKEGRVRLIAVAFVFLKLHLLLSFSQCSYISYKSVMLLEALASVKSMEHYQGRGDC